MDKLQIKQVSTESEMKMARHFRLHYFFDRAGIPDPVKPIENWLEKNPGFNKSRLINMAIRSFITTEQKLIPVETVGDEKAISTAKRMMKKHKNMLEKLK